MYKPCAEADRQMSESGRRKVRVLPVRETLDHADVAHLTVEQRLEMMWQLALDAWAFMGETRNAESRLQRHVVRVYRRER